MIDITLAERDVPTLIRDGMTIGIGGWGSRRKPLALVRAVISSGAKNLTIVSFGGPDVGLLCASGQARRIVHGFVTLDSIPIDPHFARARQAGEVETLELDEAMLGAGLRAASRRLGFEATRAGLGSDALREGSGIRTIPCPYTGETLVAMPAIPLDLALLHADRADRRGNVQCLGEDPHLDDLFAGAAATTIVSTDLLVETEELGAAHPSTLHIPRTVVDHVVVVEDSVGFTANPPLRSRDENAQRSYAAAADHDETRRAYLAGFVAGAAGAEPR
ncbi:CoA transferase subunit A [Salinibacterium sp. ZJ70]|uniref:CoA transferase subunit A n=1 Tax=Salinibacterium sp. ZJ70 TaxID=2708084 RepID=UPI0014208D77|nr:CoA transferase subunit A [Salinibacterium sp. ZJ70]